MATPIATVLDDLTRAALDAMTDDPQQAARVTFLVQALTTGTPIRVWMAPGFAPWVLVGLTVSGACAFRLDDPTPFPGLRFVRFYDIEFPDHLGGCASAEASLSAAPAAPGAH